MSALQRDGETAFVGDSSAPLLADEKEMEYNLKGPFTFLACAVSLGILAAFFACVRFPDLGDGNVKGDVEEMYFWYLHVAVMIFVGFGFLMTFLRRYCLGAVSLNFLGSAVMILESMLVVGWLRNWKSGAGGSVVDLDVELLVQGCFCAGAGMISFGALLGKVSPAQLLLVLSLEVPLYAVNAILIIEKWTETIGIQDVGGSMAIHAFGAYFGLAASMALSPRGTGGDHPKNSSAYLNDVTAMVGTVFLWIFWPSFNAATAGENRFFAVTHTVIALLGAVLLSFFTCAAFTGKFEMDVIQNATLAGGVAVGSAAGMPQLSPAGALCIGMLAGLISTLGFRYLGPALEGSMGLCDTCGVHNLHGIPGVLGGLAASVVLALHGEASVALMQLAALGCTLAIALVGGGVCGVVTALLLERGKKEVLSQMAFEDASCFEVEREEGEKGIVSRSTSDSYVVAPGS
uniref:Ammonium transporter AmtB-like domain-containing protein n=1 Tax=Chromera velia CCMP2878 TaxID=1169474 RepID=A0A0G4I772_9ALVE|eukprot:Cvel_11534.t1-p1 / transcript=Cvel_11534.t1 / gene=Cvel_11534 / organism=Chromera_velia_CCMP2878 / gene_product=Ammonium transporter Rh type C, putative / transcript_product=Ammonium transporter Rh type C, putative / location=Cvel_scaffold727:66961-69872(-) / protein_length=459 / sequence_SO=supercontig / SO=protein_coding / is_pseudo=false